MKLVLSYILYYLGDFVSKLMYWDLLSFLYPVYNKLMIWSSELDEDGVIWQKPNGQ
jgi:hypothetical protein